jgi:hypothetical protein
MEEKPVSRKPDIDKLFAAAFLAAQAEMPAVPMDSKNPFLGNSFASLGAVISTTRPVLVKHGLSITQAVYSEGDHIGVRTIIIHVEGGRLESAVSLAIEDKKGLTAAQEAGCIITYLRRYALMAALGLYAEEDTDGSGKAEGTKERPAAKPESAKPAEGGKEKLAWVSAEDALELLPGFDAETHKARFMDKASNSLRFGIPVSKLPVMQAKVPPRTTPTTKAGLKAAIKQAEDSREPGEDVGDGTGDLDGVLDIGGE